jgi:hypothetical protein
MKKAVKKHEKKESPIMEELEELVEGGGPIGKAIKSLLGKNRSKSRADIMYDTDKEDED